MSMSVWCAGVKSPKHRFLSHFNTAFYTLKIIICLVTTKTAKNITCFPSYTTVDYSLCSKLRHVCEKFAF